jgi:hypothetical protein
MVESLDKIAFIKPPPPPLDSPVSTIDSKELNIIDDIDARAEIKDLPCEAENEEGVDGNGGVYDSAIGDDSAKNEDDVDAGLLALAEECEDLTLSEAGFQVAAIGDSPHLHMLSEESLDVESLLKKNKCSLCDHSENWVCLTCHEVYCSRYANGHALTHALEKGHWLAVNMSHYYLDPFFLRCFLFIYISSYNYIRNYS